MTPNKHWVPVADRLNPARVLGYLIERPHVQRIDPEMRNSFCMLGLYGDHLHDGIGYDPKQDAHQFRFDLIVKARGNDPWDILWVATADIALEHLMGLGTFVLPGETPREAEHRRARTLVHSYGA